MIINRSQGIRTFFSAIEIVVGFVLFWIYYAIVQAIMKGSLGTPSSYLICSIAVLVGQIVQLNRGMKWPEVLNAGFYSSIRQALSQIVSVAFWVLISSFTLKEVIISRSFLFSYLALLFLVTFLMNQTLPGILRRLFFRGVRKQQILLVGSSQRAKLLQPWLVRVAEYGLTPLGLICDEVTGLHVGDLSVVGGTDDIERILANNDVGQILLLEIPLQKNLLTYIHKVADRRGIRLMVMNDLDEIFGHSLSYFHHYGFDFITIRREPLENPTNRFLKRTLDIIISLPVVLFVLPPLFLVTAIFQYIQSPGPIFFRQVRGGLLNNLFQIWKLRTMHVGNMAPAKQAGKNDPRIYPFGQFLRTTSLDEIPQFINVLFGEMSIVGPRPHMAEHNKLFADIMATYHVRTYVKPGITGLAQIRGYRGESQKESDIVLRAQCDIEYVESWSLLLDLILIAQTAIQIVRPPATAY